MFWWRPALQVLSQENQDQNPWVYETEYQIPWSRVDSLSKLVKITDELGFYDKAVEMGFITDFRLYIHHTGDIWNVKVEWVYPTWEAMNAGWQASKVWEAVGVDEDKAKEIDGGFNWVMNDIIHQDNIYRLTVSVK